MDPTWASLLPAMVAIVLAFATRRVVPALFAAVVTGGIVLAPVRFGVGWRQGVSIGYLHLSPERSWVPF